MDLPPLATPPAVPAIPVPASSLLLLRDGTAGIEVFMVARSPLLNFSSGMLVFPGGKIDPQDHHAEWAGLCDGPTDPRRVGALREMFEETGVLLAHGADGAPLRPERAHDIARRWQKLVHDMKVPFSDVMRAENLRLSTGALAFFAHWITPEFSPRRFDVHFFLARGPAGQEPIHDGIEAVDSFWITASEAVADAVAGRRPIMLPTRANLSKVARSSTVDAAIEAANNDTVVTVMTRRIETPDGVRMRIPAEAGYDIPDLEPDSANGRRATERKTA
jgi:8-oxo-dGTP pyrophosphatase MutT (NUDIX family)